MQLYLIRRHVGRIIGTDQPTAVLVIRGTVLCRSVVDD